MYCNSTVGSLPLGLSRRLLASSCSLFVCLIAFCSFVLFGGLTLQAQTLTGGGIQGTITDPDGRAVPNAEITATETDTGVQTKVKSGSGGTYSIQPLPVGPYIVEVVAKGFERQLQENITVDNASIVGLNVKMKVGAENTTVTVTDAPPSLNTTDATLGGTIENELYANLPLSMNNGPRDPTAFQYLMPGVQENPNNNSNASSTAGASGIYGGSGQTNLNQNYVEGMPVNAASDSSSNGLSGNGSGTQVANAVSVDAVDQFSVQTSGASTSFGGAGSTNYTIKSGGNQFHGTVFEILRNTMFDSWGYFAKLPSAATGFAEKPGEHQDSYGGSIGGPILKDKLFFFGSYEGYHYTKISNTPQAITIPTIQERTGDFTDALGTINPGIADPTAQGYPNRNNFQGLKNGIPTYNVIPNGTQGQANELSNITTYLASALPAPTNSATTGNYLSSLPLANQDYSVDARIDYSLSSRHKFSVVSLAGNQGFAGEPDYDNTTSSLPVPYAGGRFVDNKSAIGILSYTYVASQTIINSLKYSYTRTWGQGFSLTAGKTNPLMPAPQNVPTGGPATYSAGSSTAVGGPCPPGNENACAAGITNLPPGNASADMPAVSFTDAPSGQSNPQNFNSDASTGPQATNTFSLLDELTWIKGRHNIKFGVQAQWLETNHGSFGGPSSVLSLRASAYGTAGGPNGVGGLPFATFLIGDFYSEGVTIQTIQDVGARYRPLTPYIQDNWQVSPKLTLNLGLRYDYLQPYHEVHDRIAYLDTAIINPITGTPGVLEYAGFPNINNFSNSPIGQIPQETQQQEYNNYAPYICHCHTPVHPYNNNFEPRVGFAYAYTPTTIISAAFSLNVTHSGGVGGGNGSTAAAGNNSEFQASSGGGYAQNGSTSSPSFFLNPNYIPATAQPPANVFPPLQGSEPPVPFGGSGVGPAIPCLSASPACSPFSSIPPWTQPGTNINPLSTTGDYNYTAYAANNQNQFECASSGTYCTIQGINFLDPYYGGRGPQFMSYNLSVQKLLNKKAVLQIAYAGSMTHFLPGGSGRGPATNSISPDYGPEYKADLTSSGVLVQNPYPTQISCNSAAFATPPTPNANGLCNNPVAFSGPNANFAQSLRPYPQFNGLSDIWGDTGNSVFNSLQISVVQRPWHNLSGFVNYTRGVELDDTGSHRTQYPVGPQDGNFSHTISANRLDRGLGSSSQLNTINLTWVYQFPIGRGQAFFSTNRIVGLIGGGWQFSGIYKYRDGYPIQLSLSGGCMPQAYSGAFSGSCIPDFMPGFDRRAARINGRWGRGPGSNNANFNTISYLNPLAFECPDSSLSSPTASCAGGQTSDEPAQTFKIGNAARSAPYGLHGPGWWDIDLGLVRTFSVRETATLHLTFQLRADVTNATNSTFFNPSGSVGSWNSGSYGQVSGQNQSVSPRDWQFSGRFRF